jgi:hypothetical protein
VQLRRATGAQPNGEGGSDSYLSCDVDCATQCAHNAAHARKPESAASARNIGRKECIEDLLEHLYFGTNAPLIYRSLSGIEERLNPTSFFRASRYHIVNLGCIESLESASEGRLLVRLTNGKGVEISRRLARRLKALLSF